MPYTEHIHSTKSSCEVPIILYIYFLMEIRVFDHLIIDDGCHFRFADKGLIEE